jgi:hypothetical protein
MAVDGSADNIDIDELRKKYSRPRDELRAEAANTCIPELKPEVKQALNAELKHPIIMCQQCQAHGIIKKQYGYRVIDEQCDKCGGEGVIVMKPKLASEELQEKAARVEAMIDEAESLEELERLEAALKERTISALDSVLAATC